MQPVEPHAVGQRVDLVEHQQRVLLLDADLLQHLVGRGNLLVHRRIAAVGHVQQQIGLPGFFQRGLEARDQMVRQIADETDRVAQQHRPPAGQLPAAGAGVERGEQLVLGTTRRRRSARSSACSCRRWCSRPARRSCASRRPATSRSLRRSIGVQLAAADR